MEELLKKFYSIFRAIFIIILILIMLIIWATGYENDTNISINNGNKNNFLNTVRILSSSENKDFEKELKTYAKSKGINIDIEYAGNLEIIEILNEKGNEYDIVWNSNAIWNYMLDNSYLLSESVSVSTNPVVFAVKKSKAEELGFTGREIYNKDIVDAISSGELKFSMSNPSQTNSGASTYLGLLSVFSGSPEVLKSEHLQNEDVKNTLINFFNELDRSSGSEDYLEEIVLSGENYDVVATYEFSIINMNKKLIKEGQEPFYILYPEDGISISDSPFSYIDNDDSTKKDAYDVLKDYLMSKDGQAKLASLGRRTWYGGITNNADTTVFNPEWGINTEKYLVPIKYPHKDIIVEALGLYQNELRKPMVVTFCLDYSGSMQGKGKQELVSAMRYVLNEETASKDYIQFSESDIIYVIPFNGKVLDVWGPVSGTNTSEILTKIEEYAPTGSTNIYDTVVEALKILEEHNSNDYGKSVILMTDGQSNRGNYNSLSDYYINMNFNIPVFSIEFGEADPEELTKIDDLTNGKTFDGKSDLLKAFRKVRGYN